MIDSHKVDLYILMWVFEYILVYLTLQGLLLFVYLLIVQILIGSSYDLKPFSKMLDKRGSLIRVFE